MRRILSTAPLYLVDLLFYLERLQVVEFRLVGLKFGVELVLAGFFLVTSASLSQLMQPHAHSQRLHTVSFLSKSTTRPPLSPVAR
jgi:hypothetical protein